MVVVVVVVVERPIIGQEINRTTHHLCHVAQHQDTNEEGQTQMLKCRKRRKRMGTQLTAAEQGKEGRKEEWEKAVVWRQKETIHTSPVMVMEAVDGSRPTRTRSEDDDAASRQQSGRSGCRGST